MNLRNLKETSLRIIGLGLILFCLITFLTSCAETKTEIIKLSPPEVYLQEEKPEPCIGKNNEALLKCLQKTRSALNRANDDKRKIKEWTND